MAVRIEHGGWDMAKKHMLVDALRFALCAMRLEPGFGDMDAVARF
jgi:hypothetical protein